MLVVWGSFGPRGMRFALRFGFLEEGEEDDDLDFFRLVNLKFLGILTLN